MAILQLCMSTVLLLSNAQPLGALPAPPSALHLPHLHLTPGWSQCVAQVEVGEGAGGPQAPVGQLLLLLLPSYQQPAF
jgi:hypothetical protein